MAKKKLVKKKKKSRIKLFFEETRGELKKVSWPTRKEAWSLTKVVIVVMVVMALLLFFLDLGFMKIFEVMYSL